MRKKANREGHISKRKIKGRAAGWQGYVSLDTGKRKWVYGKTQTEVREKLERLKMNIMRGVEMNHNATVAEHLDDWLETRKPIKDKNGDYLPGRLKPTTFYRKYGPCVERYLKPRLGKMKLSKLKPRHVKDMLDQIALAHGVNAANSARGVLSASLRQAVLWERIAVSPVTAVPALTVPRREMKLWTPEEAARFLDTARADRLYAMWYLELSSGLRRGELLGLRWIDLIDNVLHIRQTLHVVKGELLFLPPKSRSGQRRVVITDDVLDVLAAHRVKQAAEQHFLGEAWLNSGLLFTNELGGPIHPASLHKIRCRLMDAAAVPRVRLHDLRHLHASILIKTTKDAKTVAQRLGHARASFTTDVYQHLFEEQLQDAATSILAYLPKSSGETN